MSQTNERPQEALIPTSQNETAMTTTAVQAAMTVKARYEIAKSMPRSVMQARSRILDACKRAKFAEEAVYKKPVGKKKNEETGRWEQNFIEGPSIRFAEVAMTAMGNMMCDSFAIYDDDDKRIVRITAIDLESNSSWAKDIQVTKTVERRSLKKGQAARFTRVNSWGDTVYIVDATDDEMENKVAALSSKVARNSILRLIPNDIVEDGMHQCHQTMATKDKEEPSAARKRVADAFDALGVKPADLAKYIGMEIEKISPAQLNHLRGIYTAMKEGDLTWADLLTEKGDAGEEEAPSKTTRTADVLKARREKETQRNAAKAKAEKQKTTKETKKKPEPEQQELPEEEPPATGDDYADKDWSEVGPDAMSGADDDF